MFPQEILRENNPFFSSAAPEPWENYDYDVSSICASPFSNLFQIVKKKSENPRLPMGILIKGENGSGKTHLMARILKRCSDEKVNALFASVIPILDSSAPMDHLNQEIITSLGYDIPGRPRYTQIHRLVTEVLKEYISRENGNTSVFKKLEGDPWYFFRPRHQSQAEAQILADKTIAWLVGAEANISTNFLRALFAYCNDFQRHIARRWLYGEAIDEEEAKEIGVTYQIEKQNDAHENAMRKRLIAITTLAARYHLTIVICFDQLEDISSNNQRSAFGNMIQTLVNFCSGTLPVVLARKTYWDDDLKPLLNQSVVEKVEMNSFTISGCSPDQINEILKGRISSKFADNWTELYDWLQKEMKKTLLQERLGHLSPREVILKANKIIIDKPKIQPISENTNKILLVKFKEAIEELRSSDPAKWSLSKEKLLSASSLYFSAKGWTVTTNTDPRTMITISQEGKKAIILINTESNHMAVGGYFTEGIKQIRENKNAYCILLADPRCTIRKTSWVATGKKKEEFDKEGGYISVPLYADICRFYALDNLRRSVVVGDITDETADGSRNITIEDLNQFIKAPEFGDPLMLIPPDPTPPADCPRVKDKLVELLRTGPAFIADVDFIHKQLSKTFPISLDVLLVCCREHEDIFKLIPTHPGLTIMLYGPAAIC